MKKRSRIWLITAAVLTAAGLLLFTAALVMSQGDLSVLASEKMKTEEITVEEDFQKLSIRSVTEDIVLLPSEDGRCRVVFYEPEKRVCSAAAAEGTLMIETKETGSWLERLTLFSFRRPKIAVYLPQKTYASLIIEESTGDVALPKDFTFGSLKITAGTGDIDCAAFAEGLLSIETSAGDISLHDTFAEQIDLSVSTGKVKVNNVQCEKSMTIRLGTGKTEVADTFCGSFSSEGSTGRITLRHVVINGRITVRRSTGDVRMEACQTKEMYLETTIGDVTVSLHSAMSFRTETRTGRIDVPAYSAGGDSFIKTTTGNIKVTFP